MGKIPIGILGNVEGKVGPVVGGSWKGIAYLRRYQDQVSQPNTAAQLAQRQKMTVAVALAKGFLSIVIKPLNDRFAVKMSGYNLFIQRNIDHIDSSGVISYPDLVFSEGTLTGFDTLEFAGTDASPDVAATWVDNSGTGTAQASDEFYAAVVNTDTNDIGQSGAAKVRSDTAATVTVASNNSTGDTLECYGAFRSADGLKVSNSEYYQEIVP